MEITSDIKVLGVIGNPIKHSLSPLIHNYIYEKYSIHALYLPIEAKLGYFEKVLDGLCFLENSVGFNITAPFKERAVNSMDWLSEEAQVIGAVNVVKRGDDKLIGYNTDWIGFVESLRVNGIENVRNPLVIGVGGAGKAVIYGLVKMGVENIYVTNRDKVKLGMVAGSYRGYVTPLDWEKINDIMERFDIVINCTKVGLDGVSDLPFDLSKLGKDVIVYDTIYNPPLTPFLKRAANLGFRVINGLDMLVLQAIYSVEIWFGFLPDFRDVKNFVLSRVGGSDVQV
ncbi:MAG: shikimate dehydrogenase [Thermosulfidibacteraceae bacterium]|jgi:shikimate dehydrogenase